MRLGAALLAASWLAGAPAAAPEALATEDISALTLGNWVTERNEAIIQISIGAGGALEGRVVSPAHPPARGELILTGMSYMGAGSWSGGTIRDPRNGRCYHAHLQLTDPEHLYVRGFIGLALFGRTQVWKRYHGNL